MAAWIDARWFWTLLILTLCGEFLLPCLLARKDPAYRPGTMAVSVLGRRGGPVARVYRLWLAWLGIWLLTTAAVYAVGAAPASRWLAAGLAVSLGGFALGAGILAALFPTGLTKDLSDPSALIHGIASALGFFALLFLPLWRALLALETDSPVMAWACFAALGLALVFFTLFVLSDKDRFQGTLWPVRVFGNSSAWRPCMFPCCWMQSSTWFLPLSCTALRTEPYTDKSRDASVRPSAGLVSCIQWG